MKAGNRWVIPCEELRPLIEEWAHRNEYQQLPVYESSARGSIGLAPKVTLGEALSHRSGVPKRRIAGILNGSNGTPNVSFDTADKLLCAMDMVDEWQTRLAIYYAEPIEVSYAEAKRLNQKESMNRDLRDPKIVGQELLDLCDKQKQIQPSLLADLNGLPAPDWTGDGFMSSNPADHHSGTSQTGNERIQGSV